MERAAAGLPTERRPTRIRTVNDVVDPYLAGYMAQPSAQERAIRYRPPRHVKKALGMSCFLTLLENRIRLTSQEAGSEKVSRPHDQHGGG